MLTSMQCGGHWSIIHVGLSVCPAGGSGCLRFDPPASIKATGEVTTSSFSCLFPVATQIHRSSKTRVEWKGGGKEAMHSG